MSDAFYNFVVFACRPAFRVSSSPIVLHLDRIPLTGRVILAPNHLSAYDVPCLMHISRRNLDFVSIVELFEKPLVGRFFRNMNAFALDRSRVDPATTRTILTRLEQDRAVVMFPEGHLRAPEKSVLAGGPFKSSLIRIAQLTGAPIIPAVILGTRVYWRSASWLPLRRVRFAAAFGEAIAVPADADEMRYKARLIESWDNLHDELRSAPRFRNSAAEADSKALLAAVQQRTRPASIDAS
jgi:1-acyl-sn-glycerol-3-phosphate acyltransferase